MCGAALYSSLITWPACVGPACVGPLRTRRACAGELLQPPGRTRLALAGAHSGGAAVPPGAPMRGRDTIGIRPKPPIRRRPPPHRLLLPRRRDGRYLEARTRELPRATRQDGGAAGHLCAVVRLGGVARTALYMTPIRQCRIVGVNVRLGPARTTVLDVSPETLDILQTKVLHGFTAGNPSGGRRVILLDVCRVP